MKGRSLRRAIETKDAIRIGSNLPLITDKTELITPSIAQEMLKRNGNNRPVNWRKVEEYAAIMAAGKWQLHSQGIIFDGSNNLLTGQNRLWAVIFSESNIYMRVSKGNPSTVANLLDRGRPQSARDLASRNTQKKHSPIEASIARCLCVLNGKPKPSVDELGEMIVLNCDRAKELISETAGMKKTKSLIMILSAICKVAKNNDDIKPLSLRINLFVDQLNEALLPATADKCWGKGTAFTMAMEQAKKCIIQQRGNHV